MSYLEWQQEMLYQRFATWEPKHTVPTVRELDRQLMRECVNRGLNAWAERHINELLTRPNFFATYSVDHWPPPTNPHPGEETL